MASSLEKWDTSFMSLRIERHFTRELTDVYASCAWENWIFHGRTVEMPAAWSETAREIVCRQYLRKFESSARQLIFRIARTLRQAGEWQKYFTNHEEGQIFEDEITFILLHQMGSFNSPVWFNLGLFPVFGILGQSENFAYDEAVPGRVVPLSAAYLRPQVSACFIQGVEDDLISIFDLLKSEAKLFKFGSGSGTNFSKLRGAEEPLEHGGTSSGLLSYLEVFDKAAQAIKSGGTTRRAAKMVCLDADHPEIEEFINWKMLEERKARVLSQAGFGDGLDSEAYRTISGQNSNNSIRLTDEFFKRVERDEMWELHERVSGRVTKTLPARALLQQMARAAWECADPGLQFHDTINTWHTCPSGGEIRASNPCSEYMFLDDSACNLASLNLVKFLREDKPVHQAFDWCSFAQAARLLFIAQDILVDYASYPTAKIALQSHVYRPLGLGYANLGGLLMRMGYPYDGEEGRRVGREVTGALHAMALKTSLELSEWKGPFEAFAANRASVVQVMKRHADAWTTENSDLEWVTRIYQEAGARIEKSGLRNAQLTLLAPTGTIGLLMDCDTFGIEPEFALVKRKLLAGGGELRLVNRSVEPGLKRLGYTGDQIVEIIHFTERNGTVVGAPHLRPEHFAVFDAAWPPAGQPERRVSPFGHMGMMAAAQPFLSGAISKTVNVPASFTVDQTEKLFVDAWKLGLKSIAIYRDSSKSAQPLCVDC